MDVAFLGSGPNGLAHEVVIEHFIQGIFCWCVERKRNVQINIENHPLLCFFLKVMHTDIDVNLIIPQKQTAAIE